MGKNSGKSDILAVDFFCGAGGMTYGLREAGVRVFAGIDICKEYKETYEMNNPDSEFIHADLRQLEPQTLAEMIGIKKNDHNLVFVGCSPCQYWTVINTNKEGAVETKNLLSDFGRFVEYFLPGYVLIENVPGLYKRKEESKLTDFIALLEKKSYAINYGIINSNHYGVPQTRKRFLLLATRVLKEIRLPEPDKENLTVVRDFIGVKNGFPKIPAGHKDDTDFLHTSAHLSEDNVLRLKLTPSNGGTRLSWKDVSKLQIPTYEGRDEVFRDTYGRLFWDKPAPAITTRFTSLSNGRFGHPKENRALSLREGATLQTFPKNYVFRGKNMASFARQIGNAVPPEIARRVGISIINSHHESLNVRGDRKSHGR